MKQLITRAIIGSLIVFSFFPAKANGGDTSPFHITSSLSKLESGDPQLTISVTIQKGHYLYADKFEVSSDYPVILDLISGPASKKLSAPLSDIEPNVFFEDFRMIYSIKNLDTDTLKVNVNFQGCDKNVCFMPESRQINLKINEASIPEDFIITKAQSSSGSLITKAVVYNAKLEGMPDDFIVSASRSGYMNVRDFISFLSEGRSSELDVQEKDGFALSLFTKGSLLLSLAGIILGGLALNLTPCVLPMIPVNIAIIGAGAGAGSRRRGFMLGVFYGAGIALCYGTLGVIVALTGSIFGAINASPWFNLAVAAIFLALALAMFDLFSIDLSRYMRTTGGGEKRKGVAVFFMGIVSALLAGACVAPVVIFVLVHSAGLYAQGRSAGLALPFLLGLGMAIPWPFIGAGIAALPKPGIWMLHVKNAFGIIILLASTYYAFIGFRLLVQRHKMQAPEGDVVGLNTEGWLTSLDEGFALARQENKPVLIDFWASWCKSCMTMKATTLKDDDVRVALNDFVTVKYRAENPERQPHREILEAFGVFGLPTYIILKKID